MVPEDYDVCMLTREQKKRYFMFAFPVLFLLGYVFYSGIIVPLLMGCISIPCLRFYAKSEADKRKNILRIQLKDMLYSISSSVNAGRHLGEAISDSEEAVSLIHGVDSLITREIRYMKVQMSELNCSEETVLRNFAKRTHIREISDFADVCIICRKTGGDLAGAVYRSVQQLCENIDLKREKDVLMSQKKLESKILAVMPGLIIALIRLSSSGYLDVMYETLTGRLLMTAALAANAGSFLWCLKLTKDDNYGEN